MKSATDKFDLVTASDGFDAGRKVRAFIPDLVILDIFLPGIDGFNVCSFIKKEHPHTKVVAITGSGNQAVRKAILEAGADAYLEKPINLKDFINLLGTLFDKIIIFNR